MTEIPRKDKDGNELPPIILPPFHEAQEQVDQRLEAMTPEERKAHDRRMADKVRTELP